MNQGNMSPQVDQGELNERVLAHACWLDNKETLLGDLRGIIERERELLIKEHQSLKENGY